MVSAAIATAARLIQKATSRARPNSRAPKIDRTMTSAATTHARRQLDRLGLSQGDDARGSADRAVIGFGRTSGEGCEGCEESGGAGKGAPAATKIRLLDHVVVLQQLLLEGGDGV